MKNKFIVFQVITWVLMVLITGLSAETMVNDVFSFITCLALLIFFASMAYLNFSYYEETKEGK